MFVTNINLYIMRIISEIFVASSIAFAILIGIDLRKNRQSVSIMNAVWIITALWSSFLGMWGYFTFGREKVEMQGVVPTRKRWQKVAISALHCGAGCALGDMIGEIILYIFPVLVIYIGFYGVFAFDILLSLSFGVFFQYKAIRSAGTKGRKEAFNIAFKSDILSLTAWQIGKMLVVVLVIHNLPYAVNSHEFLFLMQLAMIVGFFFAYPVNWFLIKYKVKYIE